MSFAFDICKWMGQRVILKQVTTPTHPYLPNENVHTPPPIYNIPPPTPTQKCPVTPTHPKYISSHLHLPPPLPTNPAKNVQKNIPKISKFKNFTISKIYRFKFFWMEKWKWQPTFGFIWGNSEYIPIRKKFEK